MSKFNILGGKSVYHAMRDAQWSAAELAVMDAKAVASNPQLAKMISTCPSATCIATRNMITGLGSGDTVIYTASNPGDLVIS